MARSKDNLFVLIHGNLEEANLVTISIPADEVGPAYKKHYYALSNGKRTPSGLTKTEACQELIQSAGDFGWIVLQRMS